MSRNMSSGSRPGARWGPWVNALLLCALVATCSRAAAAETSREPVEMPDHRPLGAGEHPRLIFRGEQLEDLERKARTEWGQSVVDRMHQALKLMAKATITGRNRDVLKEAGFKAAGHGAVYVLEGTAASAATARKIALTEVVLYPMTSRLSVMDRLSRLGGVVLAYDLCYPAWDTSTRSKVRAFLLEEAAALLEKVESLPETDEPGPEAATAWATAGLAELAVLGDSEDPDARNRIAACEKAVIHYLDEGVAERGVGLHGESVKQAVFASGILPFVHANRQVLGRDLSGHSAVRSVLVPMIYQTVPEVGMAIIGPGTMAKDRSGLFAMACGFVPEEERPAVVWLFEKVGGETYLGVVRPHQALYMLLSGLDAVEPEAPGGEWLHHLRSDRAGLGLLRTGWKDRDDLVALLHLGAIRILGRGTRWVSRSGLHSNRWSDSPGAGAMETVLGFNSRAYRTSIQRELSQFEVLAGNDVASMRVSLRGETRRRKASITVKENVDGRKVETEIEVPEGGPFEGSRSFAVDFTGRSGAPALFVLADRLEGGGEAPRQWVLHAGYECPFTTEGATFTISHGDATLVGRAVLPRDLVFRGESNPPYTNFIHAETSSTRVEVILTLQEGKAPGLQATAAGLEGGVSVGERKISLHGDRIVFGD